MVQVCFPLSLILFSCLSANNSPDWLDKQAWIQDGRLYAVGGPAPFYEAARTMAADNLSRFLGTEFQGKSISLSEITQKDDKIKTDEQFFQTLIAKSGRSLFDLRAEDNWQDKDEKHWVLISIDFQTVVDTLDFEK